jgi:hypothetical protein
MKRILTAVAGIAVLCTAAYAEDGGAWKQLFNGEDLSGWVKLGGEATYRVEEGAIVGISAPNTPNTFLCTEEDYGDFILEFEFLGHPEMNSGCQIRSESKQSYKDGRVHGYQVELEDEAQDRDWFGGIYDEGRRGWIYPTKDNEELSASFSEEGGKIWRNGEWNHIRVKAVGDHIQTWVNGTKRADLRDDETAKGFIGLQVHGVGSRTEPMEVRWRNIRIQELSTDESEE